MIRVTSYVVAFALLVAGSCPVMAQAQPPLNVAQALNMLVALRSLDGRPVVVKQGGVDVMVTVPWEFNSGVLRLRVARNISLLVLVEKSADEARQAIIAEILKGMPPNGDGSRPNAIPTGSSELDRFLKQYGDALNEPAKGSDDLARIKAADLRLDKNEIPVTVLSALVPILDE